MWLFAWSIEGVVEGVYGDELFGFGEIEVVVGGVADGDHLVGVGG